MEQSLTTEHKIEMILTGGRPELSWRAIYDQFDHKQPDYRPINQSTRSTLMQKSIQIGSVTIAREMDGS
jgi:hypothetical protein